MTEDFSSMSKDEKKGYLKALGVDPEKLGEDPPEKKAKDRTVEEETVSVKREEFSREEKILLRKKSAKIWGALGVAFHEILRATFVDVEIGEQVTVRVRPRKGSKTLNSLSVREAIKAGLQPYLRRGCRL
ncbi:hypothetical protein AKJ37_00865 [candidate division MSBL1 archaeon SCGC-AAA259I09]|uniref:Uncharacterized protein n=1 Tax=candidate division MSBL1 archaeon SCGC-AAA259I09 TaxID=1698267 RepID=A0A133UVN8_9EURY|nr:hypothetical protein AKJ37_00865 [candidate division MSBL1 archaeon SCGC-AAA259I09]